MTYLRSFFWSFLAFLALVAAFLAGYFLRDFRQPSLDDFPLLGEAYHLIQQHGLKDLPAGSRLEYGMIKGMVQAYEDPYTVFVEPPQHELETNSLEGHFGGIGVSLERDPQGSWLLFPYPDSPARQAGLQDGDQIVNVDELVVTAETSQDELISAIRGPVNEPVRLVVRRPENDGELIVQVNRAEIAIPSVLWHVDASDPRLGILKINLIAASTAEEITKAVANLQEQGATHFILDLRDNPGGLLDAGVEISRLFLADGMIMQQQYRGRDVETFRVDQPGPLATIPLAVLINHGSASAAEIIAGALQAHHRALLVGTPSFGKDIIQLVFDLQDRSSLHITAAHWWIPGLENPLAGQGLQPDLRVEAGEPYQPDPVLASARQVLLGKVPAVP